MTLACSSVSVLGKLGGKRAKNDRGSRGISRGVLGSGNESY